MNKSHLLTGAAAFAVAVSVSQPAFAQQAVETIDTTTTSTATSEDSDRNTIIVTGSRIARPNLDSTVPLTTVPVGDLTDRGDIQLGDALNELPSLRATFSQANSTRFIGTAGINLLDLRGLGTERTLVLVNGRRHVTSSPGSYDVDTNTIPVDLLERVDVITGGNSAIYGSDAVAGVVNFVTKRDFEGIKLRGQGGTSTYGDRGSYFISGIVGKNFMDGRANIAFAGEYARANAVFFSDRDYLGAQTGVGPAGFEVVEPTFRLVNGVPVAVPNRNNNGIPNTRFLPSGFTFNTVSLGGMVLTTCPAATAGNAPRVAAVCTGQLAPTSGGRLSYNYAFQPDGSLIRNGPENGLVDNRGAGGSALFGLGASGLEDAMLLPGIERMAGNLLFHVEVSPAFVPFVEAKYVRINATQQSTQPTFIASALNPIFSIDNPFLTPQARATLVTILAPGATTFQMQRFNNDLGTRAEDHKRETYRVVAGVRGDIGSSSNLSYEVALNFGRSETYYETGGNVDIAKFNRATNAVRNTAGQIVCAVNADANPANDDPACVPLNPFGYGAPSQAAKDYVLYTSSREQWAEQLNAVAFISGNTGTFFNMPGGPVGFALGGEYRKEKAYSAFDPFTRSGATFLNSSSIFAPPPVEIKEAFGEIRVPLLSDMPFANELTLEAAARYSDYGGNTGGVWAYNVGGIWSPVSDIRIRAGYARSVRAPNLGNLFATRSETFANGLVDPCSQTVIGQNPNRARNCAAAGIPTTMVVDGNTIPWVNTPASGVSGFNQGNPGLMPEVGKSLTVGAVLQPRFLPGFALTVDYYRIKITNVIQGLTGQAIINRCYDDPVGLDNPFCSAVFRRTSSDPLINFTFDGQANRTFTGQPTLNFPVLGPAFLNQPFNFAAREAEGIDFDVSYRRKFDNGVTMNLRGVATYNLKREDFSFITDPQRSTRIHGTLGDPIWAANFNANVDFGLIDVGYSARYIGKQSVDGWETQHSHQGRPPTNPDAFPFRKYPDRLYHAFRVGFEPIDKYRFYFGVDNVFNTRPPFDTTGTGAGSGIFPVQGRFFYAGFQASL